LRRFFSYTSVSSLTNPATLNIGMGVELIWSS
jgi:hypothetical protein